MSGSQPSVQEIAFGSERIPCELVRSRSTRLRLVVSPALAVTLQVPQDCSVADALEWGRKRAPWIIRQQDYFRAFLPRLDAKRWVSGETVLYLGRQYRLKVSEGKPQHVGLRGRYLRVTTGDRDDRTRIRGLIDRWYGRKSADVFERRLDACMQSAAHHGISRPRLKRRRMLRRWGSCKIGSLVLLNTNLVMAPVHCIDYVIMHELCHLKISDHGAAFCRLLGQLMPDWKRRKERLERVPLI